MGDPRPVPGGRLHAGSGQPLLLVHGFAATAQFWSPVVDLLAPHHEVLAVDLPGHGTAPLLDVVPTPTAMADALEATLDAQGWETAHIAGHSMGGLLALELARRGRARTVTALQPSGPSSVRERQRAVGILRGQRAVGRALRPLIGTLAQSAVLRTLTLSLTASRPWAMDGEWAAAASRAYIDCVGFDATLDALDPNPLVEGFATITCPTVLAYGTRDLLIPPAASHRYRAVLPGSARFVLLQGIGHALTTDAPETTAAIILDSTGAR